MEDALSEVWFKAACSLDEIKTKFNNNCGLPNVSGNPDCAKISVNDDQIQNLSALIQATRYFKYPDESSDMLHRERMLADYILEHLQAMTAGRKDPQAIPKKFSELPEGLQYKLIRMAHYMQEEYIRRGMGEEERKEWDAVNNATLGEWRRLQAIEERAKKVAPHAEDPLIYYILEGDEEE